MANLHEWIARARGFLRPDDLEHDFDDELATHLAMAEEDKIRQGLTPEEARRQARVELGGLTQLRESAREARGLPWLDNLWLDAKLGLRMLRKSWGLTLVGGLAMTVAIGVGAAVFAFFRMAYFGTLPLPEGERVIAVQTWDDEAGRRHPTALADFERWREGLRSVDDVGAFRTLERNLKIGDSLPVPVAVAEVTASGFEVARVAPLLGRALTREDERPSASPVLVIGHDVWQSRFLGDPGVVGRSVHLGDTVHTVVGVMPEGFAFPVSHRFWIPLETDRLAALRHVRPFDFVFARLAPGFTLEAAAAELATLGLAPPTAPGASHEQLRPRVVPYTYGASDDSETQVRWVIRIILLFATLLLIPPCANIAILVYARIVSRQEELAARYVLGASRFRIVSQIFVEVLVIAAGAAGVALLLVRLATRQLQVLNADAPFWVDFSLSFDTVLFTACLAVIAALIAGVVPALRATGGQMQTGLRAMNSRSGLRLGATWTALVVVQVAFSAAALPSAIEMAWGTLRSGVLGPGFAAEQYLTARLALDRAGLDAGAEENPAARFDALQAELVRQLESEPGVSEVAVAAAVPGAESWATVEVEGIPLAGRGIFAGPNMIRHNRVDETFFDAFDVPVLLGRGFEPRDLESDRRPVIVNRTFAEKLFGDGSLSLVNPLGHRVRYLRKIGEEAAEASPSEADPPIWYEIVGVVADLPANATHGTLYHPMTPESTHPASVVLRSASPPATVADRLRGVATALDPNLRIDEILALDEIYRRHEVGNNMGVTALGLVTLSVLLLSVAGIYALMSFTVNQRRREIGIRSALGASPRHLLAGIFRRSMSQVGAGALVGLLLALLLGYYVPMEIVGGWDIPGIVPTAAVLMVLIGLLATLGPARRGLRVDPNEQLREG